MRSSTTVALGAAVLASIAAAAFASAPVALADDGIDITVTVSPAPTVSGPPGTNAGGSGSGSTGSSGGRGGPASGSSTVVTGPNAEPTGAVLPTDGFDLGGILYLSGLTASTTLSPNPLGGSTHSYFTVRNVSDTTITASAAFWLDGPFGNQLSEVTGIDIVDLKPDESRIVDATLTGVGQWTFATAHATLTPPKVVEGTELSPITRDSFVVVTPWLLGAAAGVAAATLGVLTLLRRSGGVLRVTRGAA